MQSGLVFARVLTSRCPVREPNTCCTNSGVAIGSTWTWFITCAVTFAAKRRSARRIGIDTTAPSPDFGIAVFVPARTATAACGRRGDRTCRDDVGLAYPAVRLRRRVADEIEGRDVLRIPVRVEAGNQLGV